jgi:hypothetical protein
MVVIDFLSKHGIEILAFLLALSEALALIPGIKSNSIFQLIYNLLKKASGKNGPA